jgi:hypothetical protein
VVTVRVRNVGISSISVSNCVLATGTSFHSSVRKEARRFRRR